MLQVLVSDEFAAWYERLPDRAAEEVATALALIEQLGPQAAAPGSTEWVLWYQCAAFSRQLSSIDGILAFGAEAKQMLAHLESPRFRKRLVATSAGQSRAVMTALQALRVAAGVRRRSGLLAAAKIVSAGDGSAQRAIGDLRRSYRSALAALGFEINDMPAHTDALRELSLRECSPAVRLLYGVDAPRAVALAVLGEQLDREHYGASVRRAEAAWRRYLVGELTGRPPLHER